MIACCKLYASESSNVCALEAMERAVTVFPDVVITRKFVDPIYNRVGYTLVSEMGPDPNTCPLRDAAFEMAQVAYETIDFEKHCGTHPRLGAVDHISFHPLEGISLDCVAEAAKLLAADIGLKLQVPTFLYGVAQNEGRSLDSIRRELGYYKPNGDGYQWVGGGCISQLNPDHGPPRVVPSKGVVVVGASDWVGTFNVPIFSNDMDSVQRIARRVSSRGGGLQSVQSMALAHGTSMIEVACNLLDLPKVNGHDVCLQVQRLAEDEGLRMGEAYYTDLLPDQTVDKYRKLLSQRLNQL